MPFGTVTTSIIVPVDMLVESTVPVLHLFQDSTTEIRVQVDLPKSNLTGKAFSEAFALSIGVRLRNQDGSSPFEGCSGAQIGSIANIDGEHEFIEIEVDEAGTTRTFMFDVIELNKEHIFAASIDNDPAL